MSLQNILQLSGVAAVILLLLQFFFQVRRIKRGRTSVGRGRVFINWILVMVILIGFGGGGYLSYKNSHTVAAHPAEEQTETSADGITLDFKKKVRLDSDGERKVTITVSPDTDVKIVGHYSKSVYKSFDGKPGSKEVKFHYTFDEAGTYDIIAMKGDQKVVKKIHVKDYKGSSDDSSSESSSSSSSSHSSSSSSQSNRNSSNNSGSSNTGSSYSGGGSSHGGGGGGHYTPAPAPSRPSAPATPSAPSNGTGAMTGGSY